ncbi:MAG: PspA/IM30 family protein [bacterium ADurb.Bin363]|nr:MAG: PspA/IM30 family protein [bacterium ADurb.Bin363]
MFLKISQVIQAEFNQMLQKAEEPEELLEEIIADLEKQAKEWIILTIPLFNLLFDKK